MKSIIKYLSLMLLLQAFVACEKTEGFTPLTDTKPPIPVTVPNAIDYRPNPTVKASKADGKIQIVLQIPASSGRTIKEITRVAAGTAYSIVQTNTGLYNTAPIPGNGTSVTFNTTLTEYTTRAAGTIPASNAELAKRFFFMLTLDNNQVIYPSEVRVLVVD
jgi:hypothetical protein